MDSVSAYYAGDLLIESRQPISVTNVACRDCNQLPCRIHAYTVYTPIGGKGTRHDLQDHSMQARKSASKISTLDLKPMRKDTRSPKQELHKMDLGPDKKIKKKKKKNLQKHLKLQHHSHRQNIWTHMITKLSFGVHLMIAVPKIIQSESIVLGRSGGNILSSTVWMITIYLS